MPRYCFILIALCALFSSCTDEESFINTYKRTIIVYLGRDSNLSGAVENKYEYMLESWDGRNGHLVIYQDKKGEAPVLLDAYTSEGKNKVRVVHEYEEENSASPDVLTRVIEDAKNLHPADSYGLILFSHASGWLPEGAFNSLRSVILDDPEHSEMELRDFANALSATNMYFDFIVFEACLMSGIEVAYELRHTTRYILSSSAEIVSPGFASAYKSSMNYLFERKANLTAFAGAIFNYMANESSWHSGTLSVIHTAELSALSSFLQTNLPEAYLTDITGIQYFDRKKSHTFFDFEDYYSRMLTGEVLRKELTSILNTCVIYKAATPTFLGFDIERHSGLTTYIIQDIFPELNEAYKKLSWYQDVFVK